ncbi:conserved hypothetical protein [Microbacterium sp. 8M]|jgi:hypothetical protein|nr:hypothetical protein [Microbacterium sp. 8M]VXC02829.1 conserved hypothetical protein [Microbacterium sp. 8M]
MKWRRSRGVSRGYNDTPWLLREYYGAPVWGMIVSALVLGGVTVLAMFHR